MVPPEAFSTAAPQSSSDFCSGCEAGTQCEIFSSKFFSCASAGVTPAASSSANNAFLIDILSPRMAGLCYAARYLTCYLAHLHFQDGHPDAPFCSAANVASRFLRGRALPRLLYDIIIGASPQATSLQITIVGEPGIEDKSSNH